MYACAVCKPTVCGEGFPAGPFSYILIKSVCNVGSIKGIFSYDKNTFFDIVWINLLANCGDNGPVGPTEVGCVCSANNFKKSFARSAGELVPPIVTNAPSTEVIGVALDSAQAQLSVIGVPDKPGTAANLCLAMAELGISLDAIVQSLCIEIETRLSL